MNLKKLLFLCLAAFVALQAFSYPISPRPLRTLIIESQHIVVGYVASTYTPAPPETKKSKKKKGKEEEFYFIYGPQIARIAVKEVLQGKIVQDTIEVPFNPNMICPSPARYEAGTWVMAFLDEDKEGYSTHALSYGSKTLDSMEIIIYKKRVAEMQSILALKDSVAMFMNTVEWLVACAENEATRWDGTYELSPESDFMSYYSRSPLVAYKYGLSMAQMERLKNAFIASSLYSYYDFGLVDLIYGKYQAEVVPILIQKLKTLPDEALWTAPEFMERLTPLMSDKAKGLKLMEQYEIIRFGEGKTPEELRKLVSEYLILTENIKY